MINLAPKLHTSSHFPMASFSNLPPELLLCIATFVGSDYLQANTDRLLLCRSWYQIAQIVLFEHLELIPPTLRRFIESPTTIHRLVQSRIRSLSLGGILLQGNFLADNMERNDDISYNQSNTFSDQSHQFGRDLSRLANMLGGMPKLKSFSLQMFMDSPNCYLAESYWSKAITILVSSLPNSIEYLEIDNTGTAPVTKLDLGLDEHGTKIDHLLCHLLHRKDFLPSLRDLRLRLRTICPHILSSTHHKKLERIVLNLSLHDEGIVKTDLSRPCKYYIKSEAGLFHDMAKAAENSVPNFPALQTLKVIYPRLSGDDVASLDVVSGRKVTIPGEYPDWTDVDWNDDGYSDYEPTPVEERIETFDDYDDPGW